MEEMQSPLLCQLFTLGTLARVRQLLHEPIEVNAEGFCQGFLMLYGHTTIPVFAV
jgi:hypothetical protein